MSTEASENGKKITDLKTLLEYVKRAKFMQDYARLTPMDAGINYRCFDDTEKGIQLTKEDCENIARGIAEMIVELSTLHGEMLKKFL